MGEMVLEEGAMGQKVILPMMVSSQRKMKADWVRVENGRRKPVRGDFLPVSLSESICSKLNKQTVRQSSISLS